MFQIALNELQSQIVACHRCPRLVEWREGVAQKPPARFRGEKYWAKPVPSLGNWDARLVLIGLAPGAHGSNRTGRMFTGDKSGDWLFRALWKAGFCSQPVSTGRGDGLELQRCFISAACHCAPPANKPLPEEIANCRPYLLEELRLLQNKRALLGLGKIGFDAAFDAAREAGFTQRKTRPKFSHGAEFALNDTLTLLGTYHPSQQNTFTGRLTETMLDDVMKRVADLCSIESLPK